MLLWFRNNAEIILSYFIFSKLSKNDTFQVNSTTSPGTGRLKKSQKHNCVNGKPLVSFSNKLVVILHLILDNLLFAFVETC